MSQVEVETIKKPNSKLVFKHLALISRLFTLRHYRLFSDIKVTLEKHAFNYIRVLMRILSFLYKTDRLEV